MKKIINTLLIILILLLPLINSHLIDLFWIKWWFYVDWNYEFSKVIFFNIFSSIIISFFFIKKIIYKEKIYFPRIIFFYILILLLSTYFSQFWYTSLLWNTSKWHSLIMYLNLIWLFIIFINLKENFNKKLITYLIYWSILVSILWIKEYFFPTFDYWNLSNRAISTFWHPNYLAGYILLLIPFLIKQYKNKYFKLILFLLIILLFLTKSIWSIFVFFLYLFFIFYAKNSKNITKKNLYLFIIISIIILWIIIYKFWLITKLNSFVSRFYIWETTLKIIFSNPIHLIFWNWIGTLDLIFNSFKSPELYIFENIWFTADRPHNLILNIFYNFWILWISFFSYLIYKLINNYKNNSYYNSIILFLLFSIFNFWWITHYLIITLILSIIYKKNNEIKNNLLTKIAFFILMLFSIFWSIFSYNYYKTEYLIFNNKNINFNNYNLKLINNINNERKNISEENYSVIDYFYLWDLYRNEWLKKKAIYYYKKWLNLLPDMWNKNSKYYDNYFIQKLFIPERFYSEKFSNLKEILKRIWEI